MPGKKFNLKQTVWCLNRIFGEINWTAQQFILGIKSLRNHHKSPLTFYYIIAMNSQESFLHIPNMLINKMTFLEAAR